MDQVVVAVLVEPHTDVLATLERIDLSGILARGRVLLDAIDLCLRNDRDGLASFDLSALHELRPSLAAWRLPFGRGASGLRGHAHLIGAGGERLAVRFDRL